MSHVTQSSPDPDKRPVENTLLTISSADVLQRKITSILGIIQTVSPVLYPAHEEGERWKNRMELDGGVCCSAEVTMIKACARLDSLLDNDENWLIDTTDKILVDRTRELTAANLAINTERLNAIKASQRPSVVRNASLLRKGPFFYAVIGGVLHENAVYGVGKSPEEAYTNLDNILTSVSAGEKPVGGSEDVVT